MRHDETRDNTTAIEATIIEADSRDMTPVDMDNPREGWFDAVVTREDAPAKLHQGLGGIEGSDKTGRETWDERCQRMAEEAEDDAAHRPVIVHRAMLGSVERMMAVLRAVLPPAR